jgi:2-polyprenyl-6-methoxyphenol hydroxylase-like FAD-dependent oxidoreductase
VTLTEATWPSLFRANVRLAEQYRVGPVFLAGDAATIGAALLAPILAANS